MLLSEANLNTRFHLMSVSVNHASFHIGSILNIWSKFICRVRDIYVRSHGCCRWTEHNIQTREICFLFHDSVKYSTVVNIFLNKNNAACKHYFAICDICSKYFVELELV